jgi:glycosyltransferase involved in cell wall biosynthesis
MVVLVAPCYPFRGGIADTSAAFVETLQKKGTQVVVISFSLLYPKLLFPGKTPYSTEKKELGFTADAAIHMLNPLSWIRTAKRIKSLNPSLVVFRYWTPWLALCYTTIARRLKTKKIAWIDNAFPHERKMADKILLKTFLEAMDEVLCMSEHVATEVKKHTAKEVTTSFHPIYTNLPTPIDRKIAIKELGLDSSKKYILFFGLIRPYKGLDILIKSLPQLRINHPEIQLLVVGEPYEPLRKYRELAASLKVDDLILFHDRFVSTKDTPLWFGACTWVVQPYKSATQSGITPMAIHYARPSIVTQVGSLADGVTNETGLVAQPNPTSLAETIAKGLLENKKFIKKQAYAKLQEKRSWNTFCDNFSNVY